MTTSLRLKLSRQALLGFAAPLLIVLGLATSTAAHAQVSFAGVQTTVPASGLQNPFGVAVDAAGDVFIADNGNNRVVEVTPGGVQTAVPASGLNNTFGVAVDAAGDVFIVDAGNSRVVEVTPGGTQTTLVSGLGRPLGVAVDGAGDVFIADTGNNRVVEVQTQSVNFDSVNIGANTTLTLNYNVADNATLGMPKVLTLGAPNLDFTLASGSTCTGSVTGGSSCTVNVTFAPKLAGARNGAVEIVDASGNVLATTPIHGVGVGPQIPSAQASRPRRPPAD